MRRLLAAAAVLLALPASVSAHGELRAVGFAGDACGGAPIAADQVITGTFTEAQSGSYVMVPFTVPPGTTQVRVKYCWDETQAPAALSGHTIDLGLWDARAHSTQTWEERDFRGWGGSSHPDVQITPQGFAPGYAPSRRANVPGFTTRGYVPGPLEAGRWAAELGVAHVVGPGEGDPDGVRWRVEVELSEDPAFDDAPYEPARYDETPARAGAGWYAGDFHVHAEHSALGDATMEETFGFAFKPRAQGGAGLDFLTLSDYVTPSGWGEIGRHQAAHPGKLVVRSSEVITYAGHLNNHGSLSYVDHRTGPVLERLADGTLKEVRGARPVSAVLREVRERGGFTQINHPTIFPSEVPLFAGFCRGCPWDYGAARTDYRLVDAIEVSTGPAGLQEPQVGPNPFTPLALAFYDRALAEGHRIAAVGSSDSHNAGRANNPLTQAPIGQATTMVFADELSEAGVRRAVRRRHTFVKLYASDRPDLRFEARTAGGDAGVPPAIMGDVVRARAATFTVRVLGGDPTFQLFVVKDGVSVAALASDRSRVLGLPAVPRRGRLPPAAHARLDDRGRLVADLARRRRAAGGLRRRPAARRPERDPRDARPRRAARARRPRHRALRRARLRAAHLRRPRARPVGRAADHRRQGPRASARRRRLGHGARHARRPRAAAPARVAARLRAGPRAGRQRRGRAAGPPRHAARALRLRPPRASAPAR